MFFTWSTVSFAFFSLVFVGASIVSSVFILPLLFLSFVFSGFVVIFSGLSYTTFKLASSKYNHTVLFLNKLLRKLADNIPPSVGFEEVKHAKESPLGFNFSLPELNLTVKLNNIRGFISRPFKKSTKFDIPTLKKTDTTQESEEFQAEYINTDAPVTYDEEGEVGTPLVNGHEEVEETNEVDQPIQPTEESEGQQIEQSSGDDQPIKDSEVDE